MEAIFLGFRKISGFWMYHEYKLGFYRSSKAIRKKILCNAKEIVHNGVSNLEYLDVGMQVCVI